MVRCCDTFYARARGQLGAARAARQWVWRLAPCRAVHTLFLTRPIDVVFSDGEGCIVRIVTALRPFRCVRTAGTAMVWEFPAGAALRLALRPGDRLAPCD